MPTSGFLTATDDAWVDDDDDDDDDDFVGAEAGAGGSLSTEAVEA
jgi:hypothetical protein